MNEMPPRDFDVRAIANLVLREAFRRKIQITHIKLQKLVFFVHLEYYREHQIRLILGCFEAWDYGPVHKALFGAFKNYLEKPINELQMRKNLYTGKMEHIKEPHHDEVVGVVQKVLDEHGNKSASQLIELSHQQGSPWDSARMKYDEKIVRGIKITDEDMQKFLGIEKTKSIWK